MSYDHAYDLCEAERDEARDEVKAQKAIIQTLCDEARMWHEHLERAGAALREIAAIPNAGFGSDWEEIQRARDIANDTLRTLPPIDPLAP